MIDPQQQSNRGDAPRQPRPAVRFSLARLFLASLGAVVALVTFGRAFPSYNAGAPPIAMQVVFLMSLAIAWAVLILCWPTLKPPKS